MAYLIQKDSSGRITYVCDGFLTSEEMERYDSLLDELRKDIPAIEAGLSNAYGDTVHYKYYLGKCLSDFLEKYKITESERRDFWDEIKGFATQSTRKRNDGAKSKTRSFYEQCYVLSQFDIAVVEKLSWRQWQDLLDRVSNREDGRLFKWLANVDTKIREDDWREFEKGLHLYLQKIDTSVFTDEEVFEIYTGILNMSIYWRGAFAKFEKDNPNSAKIKSKARRSKKYQTCCYQLKKEMKKSLCDEVFAKAFELAMK